MRHFLVTIALLVCGFAQAAKVPVTVTAPTHNTDGTVITDLALVIVEWGSCNGLAFGTRQAAISIIATLPGQTLTAYTYPSGLAQACWRAFAYNKQGVGSTSSNIATKSLLSSPGKPVTLGKPVVISFNREGP